MPSQQGPRRERVSRVLLSVGALVVFGAAAAALATVPPAQPESYERPFSRTVSATVRHISASMVTEPAGVAAVAAALPLSPDATFPPLVDGADENPARIAEADAAEEHEAEQTQPESTQPESTQPPATEPTPEKPPPTSTTTTTQPSVSVGGLERSFVRHVNALREGEGLPALGWDGGAGAVARAWSEYMVATETFAHNPELASQVPGGWSKLSENLVRAAPSVGSAHSALAGSPVHYANMVDPGFTHIGVGVAIDAQGEIWATQIFVSR